MREIRFVVEELEAGSCTLGILLRLRCRTGLAQHFGPPAIVPSSGAPEEPALEEIEIVQRRTRLQRAVGRLLEEIEEDVRGCFGAIGAQQIDDALAHHPVCTDQRMMFERSR